MRYVFSPPTDSISVGGKKYLINTDFKIWIMICKILSDENISNNDKILTLFMLTFKNEIPENTDEAITELISFLSKGKKGNRNSKKVYMDFEKDEELIYSSFLEQYGIDLYNANLHWWKFLSLLNSLSEDTGFIKVIRYRCCDTSKIKDKDTKQFYRNMKKYYRIEDEVSEDEISSALM